MRKRPQPGSALPLLAWGEQLRAAKQRRQILARRIAIVGAVITLVGITIMSPPAPRFVWNASASAPIGLYGVTPGAPIEPGDMVIAWVPVRWRMLAAQRHYVPLNVPLVKRVAAAAGDDVCTQGTKIYVNRIWLANRLATDAHARRMPWWHGCERLRGRKLFLLMAHNPASFDGRYFGVTEGNDVIGKARLIWAR